MHLSKMDEIFVDNKKFLDEPVASRGQSARNNLIGHFTTTTRNRTRDIKTLSEDRNSFPEGES